MHTSIKMETPCEFINITPLNPLISKCQIKVCYVGDEPNRNKSVITKEVAKQIANSLPGSPIVGYYNEVEGDFEEHNREISIANGKFRVKDGTRPYGFVDLGARCWFQKFLDDGVNEREYLMTEGYLWTGQYPETQRIIDKGNNQSMELDDKLLDAYWTKDSNGKPKFFIINEAIVSKLCILGEECEPCFEGSSITNVQFSFEDDFKQQLFSMMNELKELLSKGGTQVFTTYAVKVGDSLWNAIYAFVDEKQYASIEAVLSEGERNFAVLKDQAGNVYSLDFTVAEDGAVQLADEVVAMDNYTPSEEPQFALADVENFVNEYKCGGGSSSSSDDKKKKKFAKQGKDKPLKTPDEIDERDVKMSAYTNCINNGIKRLIPGLRGLNVDALEKAGFDVSKIKGYTFKKGSKGGNSGKAEESGFKCSNCGVAITSKVAAFSEQKFGEHLCMKCQRGDEIETA